MTSEVIFRVCPVCHNSPDSLAVADGRGYCFTCQSLFDAVKQGDGAAFVQLIERGTGARIVSITEVES